MQYIQPAINEAGKTKTPAVIPATYTLTKNTAIYYSSGYPRRNPLASRFTDLSLRFSRVSGPYCILDLSWVTLNKDKHVCILREARVAAHLNLFFQGKILSYPEKALHSYFAKSAALNIHAKNGACESDCRFMRESVVKVSS